MMVKVIMHDGIVVSVLSTEVSEVEIIDINKNYADYETLIEYEQELYQDAFLHEQNYTVAHFDNECEAMQKKNIL